MSARAVWDELLRRRRLGQVDVALDDLKAVHYLASQRLSIMRRRGEVERTPAGLWRIAERSLPPDLRRPA